MAGEPTTHTIPVRVDNLKTLYDLLSRASLTLHYYKGQDATTWKVESDVTMACLWVHALHELGKEYDLAEEMSLLKSG